MDLNELFQDIIYLEKQNFKEMPGGFDGVYDEASTRKRLVEEHSDDNCIIYYYSGKLLVAFLRFILVDRKVRIISLQIAKGYEYYLLKIIRGLYNKLKNFDFDIVESEVYKTNCLSLVLHIKLGFHYSRDVKRKLRFMTQKADFLKSLEKYVK